MKNIFRLKIGLFLSYFTLFFNGVYASFLTEGFTSFADGLTEVLGNEQMVYSLMFVALLMGTFAMFKGLMRFAFKNHGAFGKKEINVISFVLSFIGTSGIFFIFKDNPEQFIILFGGSIGLIFVLFIVIFIMKFFYEIANSVKDEDGLAKKGAGWIFIMIIGLLLSSYLLLGYSGKVLDEYGCSVIDTVIEDGKKVKCEGAGVFDEVWNYSQTAISWLFFFAVIFGPIWAFGRGKDKEEEGILKDYNSYDKKADNTDALKSIMSDVAKKFDETNKFLTKRDMLLKDIQGYLTEKMKNYTKKKTNTEEIAKGEDRK